MKREVTVVLLACLTVGMLLGVTIGILAGDRGMITGVLACAAGGLVATPFVARMWGE